MPDHFALWGRELDDLHVVFVASGALRLVAAYVGLRIQEPSARGVDALWRALRSKLSALRAARGPVAEPGLPER